MKVGDYVRTKNGIKKVLKYTYNDKYENGHCVWFDNKDYGLLFTDEEVNKMKPSSNIIDLIEVGDYVNGYKVLFAGATTWDNDGNVIDKRVKINYDGYDRWLSEDFVKSILTKEQFESMEYKVD